MKPLSKITLPRLLHDLQETAIRMEKHDRLDSIKTFQKAFEQNRAIRDEIIRRFMEHTVAMTNALDNSNK